MGYSCTAKANFTLDGIVAALKMLNANTFEVKGNKYFYEIGKENSNGSMTGTIWKFINGGYIKRSGSFKIDWNGKIIRFPYLPNRKKEYAELYGRCLYQKHYSHIV